MSDQVVSSNEVDSRTEDGQYGDKKPDDAGSGSSEELPPSIDTPDPKPEPTPEPEPTPDPKPTPIGPGADTGADAGEAGLADGGRREVLL